ncbi:uncharacterized protein LOC125647586 [Ostrea edulis]|uniref:uncharacterized protein LOC125647586 n=1 Tax=Ostrea edulis TaxID=37623 RepID=UPI0024AF690E|nr:uncharacterized protein LOC125647586 [Ostrea edulis]
MDSKYSCRNVIWIVAIQFLLHQKLEACPPLKQQDLLACWNMDPCCTVQPSHTIDQFGFGCFRGCVKKCSTSRKMCFNPCLTQLHNLQNCINTDPLHCDVNPIMQRVGGQHCFSGCTQYCE